MPELPDVEHTRKNLERWMRGARFARVATTDSRIVRPKKPRTFVNELTGRTVERVERRGKWLRLTLDDGRRLFIHLGMTGWFEHDETAPRFERVRFELDRRGERSSVVYVDSRRWGRMIPATEDIETWKGLGPDPLADSVDVERLAARLSRRKGRTIKEALMDQTILAGVGNVLSTEALWKAKIDPRSRASAVSTSDLRAIARGLRWSIARTLAHHAKGDEGGRNPFRIYGRKGERCPRCGAELEQVTLGGRTTVFCPGCQVRRSPSR